ncbi:DUF1918 domain-containing protein [Streptomyces sp. NPDC054797]
MRFQTKGSALHAHLSDRIVVGGPTAGRAGRDGEAVGLRREDAKPPYDIRWSDTGRTTLFLPGPDAHLKISVTNDDGVRDRLSLDGPRFRAAREPTGAGYGERRQSHISCACWRQPWSGKPTTPQGAGFRGFSRTSCSMSSKPASRT